jgi:hypothetical protein
VTIAKMKGGRLMTDLRLLEEWLNTERLISDIEKSNKIYVIGDEYHQLKLYADSSTGSDILESLKMHCDVLRRKIYITEENR